MKLCIDCRFFTAPLTCSRERILEATSEKSKPEISPVDGKELPFEPKAPLFSALAYRTKGDCGMEGKYFEAMKKNGR